MTQPLKEPHATPSLGLWLYLMTDLMLFAALFATYMILKPNTAGGVSSNELFTPAYALVQTIILLASSVTSGLAYLAYRYRLKTVALFQLGATILLGLTFLVLEVYEFSEFIQEGHSWQASAFLSGFYTLVGTHGAHITIGLIWAAALFVLIMRRDLSSFVSRKLGMFTIFWHFLDLVWIWIFTVVYLLGSMQ